MANTPRVGDPPPPWTRPTAIYGKGRCFVCAEHVALRIDGTLRKHGYRLGARGRKPCKGSYEEARVLPGTFSGKVETRGVKPRQTREST